MVRALNSTKNVSNLKHIFLCMNSASLIWLILFLTFPCGKGIQWFPATCLYLPAVGQVFSFNVFDDVLEWRKCYLHNIDNNTSARINTAYSKSMKYQIHEDSSQDILHIMFFLELKKLLRLLQALKQSRKWLCCETTFLKCL